MRLRPMILGAAIATTLAIGAAPASAQPAKKCSSSYKLGVIGGAQKCLRAGEQCQRAHKSQYPKYGFACVNGHLKKR